MKFQKLLMSGCRDMDKSPQKYLGNKVCPPFVTPKIFFKNPALSPLYPYGVLTSCKTRQVYNGPRVAKLIAAIRKQFSVKSDF